jgi:hypothetical protein
MQRDRQKLKRTLTQDLSPVKWYLKQKIPLSGSVGLGDGRGIWCESRAGKQAGRIRGPAPGGASRRGFGAAAFPPGG